MAMGGSSNLCLVVLTIALAVVLPLPQTSAKPIYRGVATNAWAGGCADLAALTNVSWYYNWDITPETNTLNCSQSFTPSNRYVEFVPTIWGRTQAQNFAVSQLPVGTKYMMAFNEPNFSSQSNLRPAEAAALWLTVEAKLSAAGLLGQIKLGAPSASPGGNRLSPQEWVRYFHGNCSTCHFDFQCMHTYDCNSPHFDAGGVNYWIGQLYAAGGNRPLWLTEFDCPSDSGGVTENQELQWMERVLSSLDADSRIERYAWFTARATNVGTIPSLLTSNPGELTAVGVKYNSNGQPIPRPTNSPTGGGAGTGGGNGGTGAGTATGTTGGTSGGDPGSATAFASLSPFITVLVTMVTAILYRSR